MKARDTAAGPMTQAQYIDLITFFRRPASSWIRPFLASFFSGGPQWSNTLGASGFRAAPLVEHPGCEWFPGGPHWANALAAMTVLTDCEHAMRQYILENGKDWIHQMHAICRFQHYIAIRKDFYLS